MATTAERVRGTGTRARAGAEEAANSDVAEHAGRVGLIAQGAIYCLMAALCAGVAVGHDEGKVDQRGAIGSLAERGMGRVILLLLALGFAGYAVWRTLRAITGRTEGGTSREGDQGVLLRLADLGRAAFYAALCTSTVRVLLAGREASGGDAHGWTARLLDTTFGPIVVGLLGAAVIAGGGWLAWRGWHEKFASRLQLSGLGARHRRATLGLGRVGYVARGVVFAVVGCSLVTAAAWQRSDEPIGVDETLRRVVASGLAGKLLVLVAAGGFAAFGLFSFVQARYRKVLDE